MIIFDMVSICKKYKLYSDTLLSLAVRDNNNYALVFESGREVSKGGGCKDSYILKRPLKMPSKFNLVSRKVSARDVEYLQKQAEYCTQTGYTGVDYLIGDGPECKCVAVLKNEYTLLVRG